MKKLDIRLNNRPYQLICDADQADHVRQLADEVDSRVQKCALSSPRAEQDHVLMMTTLILADELYQARQEAGELHEKHLLQQQGLGEFLTSDQLAGEQRKLSEFVHNIQESMELLFQRLETGN